MLFVKLKKQNKGALCEVPPFIITVSSKLLNQNLTVHISRSFQTHDFQDSRSHISQATVFYFRSFVFCYVHTRNRVQRVSRIRSAVFVQGMISVTVVGDDDSFVTLCFSSSITSFTQASTATTAFSIAS
mgnify:CR=1 FL=1